MMPWRRRRNEAAERFAATVNAPTPPADPETAERVALARSLAPGIHPREEWHAALKDRVLREAAAGPAEHTEGAGSHDGAEDGAHLWHTEDAELGTVTLADVEPLPGQRVSAVLARLRDICR